MKGLSFFGVIILLIGGALYYFNQPVAAMPLIIGVLCGVGLGLVIGGVFGYLSKGSAIKEAKQRAEFKKLQLEKEELEKKLMQ